MSKRPDRLWLEDIHQAVERIEQYIAGLSWQDFCKTPKRKMLLFAIWKSLVKQ